MISVRTQFAIFCLLALQACTFGLGKLQRELNSTRGAEGEIHGAYAQQELYVFTYRNPKNFFDYYEISLIPQTREAAAAMAQAHRHDRVRIKGSFADNPSPQRHVDVSDFEFVKRYAASPDVPKYDYPANVPTELEKKDAGYFLVHAVQTDGRILVVEYRDLVLPIYVHRPELTRHLARNDVVRLRYRIQSMPDRPIHLRLRDDVAQPIEVVDSVMALHGKRANVEGTLVLFPKSPQVEFNVFAVLQDLPGDLRRQFTLANFENKDTFAAIRDKLQKAWDASPDATGGRNKLISKHIRIRAAGIFNEVDPNQANAQILLDGPDSLQILQP